MGRRMRPRGEPVNVNTHTDPAAPPPASTRETPGESRPTPATLLPSEGRARSAGAAQRGNRTGSRRLPHKPGKRPQGGRRAPDRRRTQPPRPDVQRQAYEMSSGRVCGGGSS